MKKNGQKRKKQTTYGIINRSSFKMNVAKINTDIFLKNNSKSQELLYKYFAPKMYGICLRFAGNQMEADDIMQEGFIKVFTQLKNFRNEGSFEGWIRRTFINTAINYYYKSIRIYEKLNNKRN